jgi:translation initiation factor 1 (eIF-1/SUI1)
MGRIFKWVALQAAAARKMPAGTPAPRRGRSGRVLRAPGGGGDGAGGAKDAFSPAAALRVISDVRGALYTRTEANAVLTTYIAARGLAVPTDKRRVLLDPWLADAVTGRSSRQRVAEHAAAAVAGGGADMFPALPPSSAAGASRSAGAVPTAAGYAAKVPTAVASGSASAAASTPAEDDDDDDDDDDSGDGGGDDQEDDDEGDSDDSGDDVAALTSALDRLLATASAGADATPPPAMPHTAPGAAAAAVLREDVMSGWSSRMLPCYTLSFPITGDAVLRSGAPPPIRLFVRRLQGGRKHTTHCQGHDTYRLPGEALARDCSRMFSAAATVQPAANNPGIREVFVQGDVADELAAHIVSRYGIPRRLVDVARDGGGKGGKGGGGGKK